MSGHSKWATIKRSKNINDAKRGNLFTKCANNITVAARQGGGDLDTNFHLRLAIDKAKLVNMPKENIERAIKRGTGELTGGVIEELIYGALLPGQIAVIIKCLSDNKNRALTDVKTAIIKNGGQFVELNSISWQFENLGVIKVSKQENDKMLEQSELELFIINAGAQDYILEGEDEIIIYTVLNELQKVKESLEKNNVKIISADLEMVAKETKETDEATFKKITKILEALNGLDDVSDYYTNLK